MQWSSPLARIRLPRLLTAAFTRPQTVGRTGFATSGRGIDRLRRPNPRLDPTGLRPAAQSRTPLCASATED